MSIVSVNLENLSESARAEVMRNIEQTEAKKDCCYHGVKDGETFKIGDIEFIKFPAMGEGTPVMARNVAFRSRFGDNNDFRQSDVLKKMEAECLPKIIKAIGKENLCTIHTDLTTLDGLKPYGIMESLVSLPNFDFYRANVEIFDKYKVDEYCWLATPESAQPHDNPYWVLCVSPSGYFYDFGHDGYDCYFSGVRPFYIFKSSIFESSEE